MVFGVIEGDRPRHRPSDELGRVLLAVPVDVDVEPLLRDVVGRFGAPIGVVVVPDDWDELVIKPVLQLNVDILLRLKPEESRALGY